MTQQELNSLPLNIQNSIECACVNWGSDAAEYVRNIYHRGVLDGKLGITEIINNAVDRLKKEH